MSLFKTLQVYCDDTPRVAAMNMAVDEALLESAEVSSVRFYRWDHPALSFGYFGKYEDVACHQSERDLVRRWTGGGIVFHGDDLTYALVIPANASAFAESSISIYEKIHKAMRDALAANGAPAELVAVAAVYDRRQHSNPAVTDRPYNGNACFQNPVRADVLVNGRKIAGAAQRRSRTGLLQQGSIQNIDLREDFPERFAQALSVNWKKCRIDEQILTSARQIAEQKYDSESWLRRR
jgi:lipoate-protein ligase A